MVSLADDTKVIALYDLLRVKAIKCKRQSSVILAMEEELIKKEMGAECLLHERR